MRKLTAFNLYERRSPSGYHDAPESDPGRGVEVYLASDVDRALHQIRNALPDADYTWTLSPSEIRSLIDNWLMER